MMKKKVAALCVALLASQASVADDLSIALGAFDIADDVDAMVQLEYTPELAWAGVRPQAGLFVTERSTAYAYAGLGYPLSLSERWLLSPSISVGYYHQGDGQDLGHHLEFYSQLQLDYRLADAGNLGVAVAHISNAGLADKNPGANTAYLRYAVNF